MEPITAQAAEKPCELYRYHHPRVTRTQGHHIHPVYLQNRVWGGIRDNELKYVCGSCHDAIHDWLYWLMGERNKPNPEPGSKAKAEAQRSYDWFLAAQAEARG